MYVKYWLYFSTNSILCMVFLKHRKIKRNPTIHKVSSSGPLFELLNSSPKNQVLAGCGFSLALERLRQDFCCEFKAIWTAKWDQPSLKKNKENKRYSYLLFYSVCSVLWKVASAAFFLFRLSHAFMTSSFGNFIKFTLRALMYFYMYKVLLMKISSF